MIDEETVKRAANIAKLELSGEEISSFSRDLVLFLKISALLMN